MELVGGTVAVVSLRIDAVEGLDGENHILIRLILHLQFISYPCEIEVSFLSIFCCFYVRWKPSAIPCLTATSSRFNSISTVG